MSHSTLVKALLIVLFVALGLLVFAVVVGIITQTLDATATVLSLAGIVSGGFAGLIAKGGGDS